MSNQCDGCTFCCLTMAVGPPLDKPKDTWCVHAKKGVGCNIYNSRPHPCHVFKCMWLAADIQAPDMRPDRCKVMFVMTKHKNVLLAHVHKDYPNAWREGRVAKFIRNLREKVHIIVVWRDQRTFLGGKGPIPPDMEKELSKLEARPG